MKKIILIISLVCTALAVGMFLGQSDNEVALSDFAKSNVEALGFDDCPNGCLSCGPGCYCNGSYSSLFEAEPTTPPPPPPPQD
jgi:hypothetical protein